MVEEIIKRIKERSPLGKERLAAFVGGYLSGAIGKEDATRILRAVCDFGLSDADAVSLTEVMLESGDRLSFKPRKYLYADKHSTGGVADSTTLVIAPIVAAAGVPFLKMSGRKLGHTGGTIDKLECFSGFRTELSVKEAEAVVDKTGAAIIAQSKDLVPADKALYKLRDETDTVKSLPLIASSVVSKKLASGADVLVLDVKTGAGAFMDTLEEGKKLAQLMVRILHDSGRQAAALLSDMNSPLGEGIGGVMEVIDAIEVLEGKESRLRDLSVAIAGLLIARAKKVSEKEGQKEAFSLLKTGKALAKLKEIVAAQGGSLDLFSKETRTSVTSSVAGTVSAPRSGFVEKIDCVSLGNLAREFENAGGFGMTVPVKIGSPVAKGDVIVRLFGETKAPDDMLSALSDCFTLSPTPIASLPLVYEIVT